MLLWKVEEFVAKVKRQGNLALLRRRKIICFKIEGSKVCNFTFFRLHPKAQSRHIQMVSTAVPSCLVKMGSTQKKSVLSEEIWDYLFSKDITVTAEYLPGLLKLEADTQSRAVRDASKWKLNPSIFQKNCKYKRALEIYLFASQISHQLHTYMSWKLDPYSQGRDVFQISWANKNGDVFPPFCLIGQVLKKI